MKNYGRDVIFIIDEWWSIDMHAPLLVAYTHGYTCMRHCMWRLHMHVSMHAPKSLAALFNEKYMRQSNWHMLSEMWLFPQFF